MAAALLVKGHGLIDEGRSYRFGYRQQVGSGRCSCGAASPADLASDAERKRWHREHKLEVSRPDL